MERFSEICTSIAVVPFLSRTLPADAKNPMSGGAEHDDLILWLAYKEAKALIGFDPPPAAPAKPDGK